MDLNLLLDTTSDGVALTDANGNFTFFNQAHCALFGYDQASELMGSSWRVLYPQEEITRLEKVALPALAEIGHWQGLMQAKRRDGSYFNERLSLSMLADGGVLCICNELTEDQLWQSKLGQVWHKRSEEMEQRGRLFSLANHEMRAPLASILLAAEMLDLPSAAENPEKRTRLIKEIRSQALRVGGLMDKFLFLGSQFSGVLPFSPTTTDLRVFLQTLATQRWGLPSDSADCVSLTFRKIPRFVCWIRRCFATVLKIYCRMRPNTACQEHLSNWKWMLRNLMKSAFPLAIRDRALILKLQHRFSIRFSAMITPALRWCRALDWGFISCANVSAPTAERS